MLNIPPVALVKPTLKVAIGYDEDPIETLFVIADDPVHPVKLKGALDVL
jgi:hypothetical protein